MVNQGDETIEAFQRLNTAHFDGVPTKQPFLKFLYNSEDKTIFGRTVHSWCK